MEWRRRNEQFWGGPVGSWTKLASGALHCLAALRTTRSRCGCRSRARSSLGLWGPVACSWWSCRAHSEDTVVFPPMTTVQSQKSTFVWCSARLRCQLKSYLNSTDHRKTLLDVRTCQLLSGTAIAMYCRSSLEVWLVDRRVQVQHVKCCVRCCVISDILCFNTLRWHSKSVYDVMRPFWISGDVLAFELMVFNLCAGFEKFEITENSNRLNFFKIIIYK